MNAAIKNEVAKKARLAATPTGSIVHPSRSNGTGEARGTASYQVTQPVLFKRLSPLAAIILSLRAAAPAVVSSVTLYGLSQAFGLASTEFLSTLTVLVTVLSIVLLQPSRNTAAELLSPHWRIAAGLLARWGAVLASLIAIGYAIGYVPIYPQPVILLWAAATPALLILVTLALDELARRVVCRPQNCRSVVFVGCNDASRYLAERFARHSALCMSVKGFFDDRSSQRLEAPDFALLGPLSELPAFVKSNDIDVIFISLPMRHIRRVHDLLDALGDTTVSLYYLPDVIGSDLIHARSGEILGVPVITIRETPFHGYRAIAKRLMDVSIAALALVLLAPFLIAIVVAIRLTSPGPAVFHQRRYGLDGREIVIYKFRTMTVTEDDSGWLAQARRDDTRITPIGRFLRRWSLDEFPQLINVIQGRMSLVGPRPHAVGHNEEYRRLIKGYMVRHKVPPGITGLAQVKGYRGETRALKDMQSRVHYDLEYLRNWSLLLDLKILLMTLPVLFRNDKAY